MILLQIFSVKRFFDKFCLGQITFFGKINFRSNGVRLTSDSVKWTFGSTVFGQMDFWLKGIRPNGVRSTDFSVKRCSVKKNRWNDFSVKWSRTFQLLFKIFLLATYGIWGKYWFSDGKNENFLFLLFSRFSTFDG
jgi:hypothetical protein